MDSGFYNAAIKMASDSIRDLDASSENLANANMPGYKKLNVSHTPFVDVLDAEVENGTPRSIGDFKVDYTQGPLRPTDRPLDFAIEGDGFFVLSDGDKTFYSRNGGFRLSSDGTVVNTLGMALQTISGDLRLPPDSGMEQVTIDDQRNVRVGTRVIGQLKVVSASGTDVLERAGSTLFLSKKPLEVSTDSHVSGGFLEQSNSSMIDEMVSMMTTLRNYEACQKMLRSVDDVESKMMSKLV
jgi:flagellar basal body rod protein FlgG